MRWELNDLARRLDEQPAAVALRGGLVPAPVSSDSGLTPEGRRMLEAIEGLPEAFDLVKIQGMTDAEAGQVLGVSCLVFGVPAPLNTKHQTPTRPEVGPTAQGHRVSVACPAMSPEVQPCPTTRAWSNCSTSYSTRKRCPKKFAALARSYYRWSANACG
jgi:hypothetical protein